MRQAAQTPQLAGNVDGSSNPPRTNRVPSGNFSKVNKFPSRNQPDIPGSGHPEIRWRARSSGRTRVFRNACWLAATSASLVSGAGLRRWRQRLVAWSPRLTTRLVPEALRLAWHTAFNSSADTPSLRAHARTCRICQVDFIAKGRMIYAMHGGVSLIAGQRHPNRFVPLCPWAPPCKQRTRRAGLPPPPRLASDLSRLPASPPQPAN
jgi:hypothetical protein